VYTLLGWCEDMVKDDADLRHGERNYHDKVFEHEINELINVTQSHYEATNYKDALKYGFYELQSARDWYREVTSDLGMHSSLVTYWMSTAALLIAPIAPHFAEHIWSGILKHPQSVQLALWPTPNTPVDRTLLEAAQYMRGTIKTIRDAEAVLVKMMSKGKDKAKKGGQMMFDPRKPKSVRVYVATRFPEWQDTCVQAVREAYEKEADRVDDVKVRELLMAKGLIKDKRAMPFVQAFKKRMTQFGAETAFRRTVPFSESGVLQEILPYLKKSLNLVDAEVMSVDEARSKAEEGVSGYSKAIIETSEPGNPAFEFRNV